MGSEWNQLAPVCRLIIPPSMSTQGAPG